MRTVLYYERQNVFFTLFFGYLCICLYEYLHETPWMCGFLMGCIVLYVHFVLAADYGIAGVGAVFLFYLLRRQPLAVGILGMSFLSAKWRAFPAYILIGLYNGKRGFVRRNAAKYLFYAVYPLHLLVLWYVKYRIVLG